jgi:diketogulonate reductase-like aldo/keto reductase
MPNKFVALPDGERVPQLGIGTWQMAEDTKKRAAEIASVRRAVEMGMSLVDTAEMYGEGKTETLLSEALAGLRETIFLVSKVYPYNASRKGVIAACERSLRRLKTDRLDLYLLHWRGNEPLAETVRGFEDLQREGKIRHWGVSNFDTEDMQELAQAPGGKACATNQILYNFRRRSPEWDLLPWMAEHHMPVMAYSPIEQGRLPATGALSDIGKKHGVSRFTVALAWLLRNPNAIVIPKASSEAHLQENAKALDVHLDAEDLAAIDAAFQPPSRKQPLELL